MNWAAGRRCTDTPDPGPATPTPFLWADGTPVAVYPQPPTASEWRALVAKHGLPMTAYGETVGNWPKKENWWQWRRRSRRRRLSLRRGRSARSVGRWVQPV